VNVTTDPRLLKQLLLSQWTQNVNPLGVTSSGTSETESAGLFDMLLNQLMDTSSQTNPQEGLSLSALLQPNASWGGALLPDTSGSSSAFDDLIAAAGEKYGVSPSLIKGVIQSESSFDPNAVSSAGAKGLMQLMDGTAQGLGVTNAFDPAQNIDGGTRFLSYLLRKYDGNESVALAAYNAGPGRVDRLGITSEQDIAAKYDTLPQETQQYISKVLAATNRWSL
jgi:soluble lytic murein transglycosylase-like protein